MGANVASFDFVGLGDVLYDAVFAIPDYQRDYSWGNGDVDALLDDLIALYEYNEQGHDSTHFLGTLVLIDYDESVSRLTKESFSVRGLKMRPKRNVIDGQQRLTTVSLILIAVRDFASKNALDVEDVSRLLDTSVRDDESKRIPALNFAVENTRDCYRNILYLENNQIDKRRRGASNLLSAKQRIDTTISELFAKSSDVETAVGDFINQIKYGFTVVPISCGDESDAYQIFESLNATGLALTPAEQVKNLVLMKSKSADVGLSNWDAITSKIDEASIVPFLAHYLFYKNSERVPKRDIYRVFKEKMRTESITPLISDLKACAEVYSKIKSPSSSVECSETLLDLSELGQEQVYVPLLAAGVRFGVASGEFSLIADSILVFIVRHQVCSQSTNTLDGVFAKACEEIKDESKSANDIVTFFKKNQQRDDDFKNYFKKLTFEYNAAAQRKARIYLKRIEQKERGTDEPLKLVRKYLTAEHIIPKQPDLDQLASWVGLSAVKSSDFDIQDFTARKIQHIGNMLLLYKNENSSAGNDSYCDKKAVYSSPLIDEDGNDRGNPRDVFKLVAEQLDNYPDAFTGEEVADRAKTLAEKAVRAWS